ncbi:MAG: HAD family phosphatase [Eubacterium sp.]|nr:HAD family phosphatase [Eubacterium sp.]
MNKNYFERLNAMQGAIFDLDGTLLDSMDMWSQIDVEFLSKRGIPLPPDYQEAVTPMPARDAAYYTIERFGLQESPEDLMAEWAEMSFCHYRDDIPLKPYALEYVRMLHNRGIPMTIATSSAYESVEAACRRTKLLPYIQRIITSEEVGKTKEHPDIYLVCAGELCAAPENCIVYEDIIEGIDSAGRAGFFTVGILEPGYAKQDQIRAQADCVIGSFAELLG